MYLVKLDYLDPRESDSEMRYLLKYSMDIAGGFGLDRVWSHLCRSLIVGC